MPVRRNQRGQWVYRKVVKLRDGSKDRIFGTPSVNTKAAAEAAERAHIERVLNPPPAVDKKEVPTFSEWFKGRFWDEWVIGRQNKPSEVRAKENAYQHYLLPHLGELRLDEIGAAEISRFRAFLVGEKLAKKTINNILAVLSKPLRYAVDVGLIARAPKVGLVKTERPEIIAWEIDEYAKVLDTARAFGASWYAAVCLAGEAGLRAGEIRELRWREDVDILAGTITVSRQSWDGVVGTTKGGTRRTIPMTPRLREALMGVRRRDGLVICNDDGSAVTEGKQQVTIYGIYKIAELPRRAWHVLRHTFGTHAALFGVNPWRLQAWMGHKRIDETMLYVHVAGAHARPVPTHVLEAGATTTDPDRKILFMLGARGTQVASGSGSEEGVLEKIAS